MNTGCYSDVFNLKDLRFFCESFASDITKISELLELFRQRNNSNGLVVSSMGERRTHIGRASKAEEDYTIYSDETLAADDRAYMLKLKDATLAAIDEARFAQIVNTLAQTAEAPITGRVQDVVELTGKSFALTTPEQDDILKYLIQGGDLSLYGLTNAITRASQDSPSYDRATVMESIGWQVATMPASQWKEINGA